MKPKTKARLWTLSISDSCVSCGRWPEVLRNTRKTLPCLDLWSTVAGSRVSFFRKISSSCRDYNLRVAKEVWNIRNYGRWYTVLPKRTQLQYKSNCVLLVAVNHTREVTRWLRVCEDHSLAYRLVIIDCVHSEGFSCPEINTGVTKYLISFIPRANTHLAASPSTISTAIFTVSQPRSPCSTSPEFVFMHLKWAT